VRNSTASLSTKSIHIRSLRDPEPLWSIALAEETIGKWFDGWMLDSTGKASRVAWAGSLQE
jgi:hypothetical protein